VHTSHLSSLLGTGVSEPLFSLVKELLLFRVGLLILSARCVGFALLEAAGAGVSGDVGLEWFYRDRRNLPP